MKGGMGTVLYSTIVLYLPRPRNMTIHKDEVHKTFYCKLRYTDWTGKVRQTTKRGFATRREAKAYETEFLAKASASPETTVDELIAEKLAHDKQRLKASTCYRRNDIYKRFISPMVGKMALSKLTPNVIRKWQNELPSRLSPSSIIAINNVFCALLNFGVKFYGMASNPFTIAGKTGHFERRKVFLEPAQFDKLIAVVDKPYYHLLFRLLYFSGLRIGEAMALTVDDVDFTANTIRVDKTVSIHGTITPPKTANSVRTVTLPPDIISEISSFIAAQYCPPKAIFKGAMSSVHAMLSAYCEKAGIPHISPHGLRHSHATMLIQHGIPVTDIAQRLGHTPKETLATYAHVYKNSDAAIADLLCKFTNTNIPK